MTVKVKTRIVIARYGDTAVLLTVLICLAETYIYINHLLGSIDSDVVSSKNG